MRIRLTDKGRDALAILDAIAFIGIAAIAIGILYLTLYSLS